MNRPLVTLAFVPFALALAISASADEPANPSEPPRFELRDGDHVIFLGGTLIEREQKYGYWETMLTARWPDRNITFRNLGWDGDTVWAESRGIFDAPQVGYQRMLDHVKSLKPTVIFLAYGNNEAFAGEEGVPRFITQYEKLLDDLKKAASQNVRFVILAPVPHEPSQSPRPNAAAYNRQLTAYIRAVQTLAQNRGIHWVGFDELANDIQKFREIGADAKPLTTNGQHLSGYGYLRTANFLSVHLLERDADPTISLNADGNVLAAKSAEVTGIQKSATSLSFSVTPQSLPIESMVIGVENAPPGRYELRLDGRMVDSDARKTPGLVAFDAMRHAGGEPTERLRQAIIAKNELYYHHWRPQNITYLFGFRKHEQGQNAKEVEEFEKLVAAKEAEIARLRVPVKRTYELIRTPDADK